MDAFGRRIDYLRISITDRCNERCTYCMPEDFSDWLPADRLLSFDEILAVVRTAASLGFSRFRITGGEPLLREGVVPFIGQMKRIQGVQSINMTTNATLFARHAQSLKDAGLDSVNISLDALTPNLYHRITRGKLDQALAGIEAALRVGISRIKLNTVLMKAVNEAELWPIIRFAADRNLAVRFIEMMPLSVGEVLDAQNFLSLGDARRILQAAGADLDPIPEKLGYGPAEYYRLRAPELGPRGVTVGFIGAITNEHFCETCNKMRLTADGMIRPCLGNHGEIDIKPALRDPNTSDPHESLRRIFQLALRDKPREHLFRSGYQPLRIMTAIGG